MHNFPHCLIWLKGYMQNYNDRFKRFLKKVLTKIEYIQSANANLLENLVYALNVEHFDKESYIFKPGMSKERLMFIAYGEAEISFTFNDKNLFKHRKIYQQSSKEFNQDNVSQSKLFDLVIPKVFKISNRICSTKFTNNRWKVIAEIVPLMDMGFCVDSVLHCNLFSAK